MMGRSGAALIALPGRPVMKRGGTTNIKAQADLCTHLGHAVCPDVYCSMEDCYVMEELESIKPDTTTCLKLVVEADKLLQKHVWHRPPLVRPTIHELNACVDYMNEHDADTDGMPKLLRELHQDPLHGCLIHGDSTCSNMMRRSDDLVIIDPVPPRRNVPSFREIDIAAFLQSAAGWEYAAAPRLWPSRPVCEQEELIAVILGVYDKLTGRRALFWAAYKCLRIITHSAEDHTTRWAWDWFYRFHRMASE